MPGLRPRDGRSRIPHRAHRANGSRRVYQAPKKYANCTELNKDYKHGVARKGARDRTTSGRPVTTFTVNNAVYALNKTRDRDRDGVACEKR